MVLYAVLLSHVRPQLTFVGIGVALLNILAMRVVIRLRATRTAKLRADTARLTNTAYTGLQLIETMKATGGEDGYPASGRGSTPPPWRSSSGSGCRAPGWAWSRRPSPPLNSGLILWIGGMRAVEGHISIGLLVAFQALVVRFTAPLTRLNGVAGPHPGLRRRRGPAEGRGELPRRPALRPPRRHRLHPAGCTATWSCRTSPSATTRSTSPCSPASTSTVGPGRQVAPGRRLGQRQVHRVPADLGAVRPVGRRDPASTGSGWRRHSARGALASSVSFVDQDVFLFEGSVRDNAWRCGIRRSRTTRWWTPCGTPRCTTW
ncbi:hypothetical protein LV779_21265 [Streptomyces thinghirensis]|nr:hypothetical protein [Streptomyces thinghirensis]